MTDHNERAPFDGYGAPGYWIEPTFAALLVKSKEERMVLRECLSFFASVIKSGEPWTDTCQHKFDSALAAKEGKV